MNADNFPSLCNEGEKKKKERREIRMAGVEAREGEGGRERGRHKTKSEVFPSSDLALNCVPFHYFHLRRAKSARPEGEQHRTLSLIVQGDERIR